MTGEKSMHGTTKALGCDHLRLGNFCKLIPDLESWAEDFGIKNQGEAEHVAAVLGGPGGIMHDVNSSSRDSGIPAAYTFFAQFIDHDVTLETRSRLYEAAKDDDEIDSLPNLRSASLDLDCVYGFGPEAMPFIFDPSQKGRLLVGNEHNPNDLPRNEAGRALIGDPRNDENIFVSQIQFLFLRFHNRRLVGRSFEEAQRDCRYHYQWLVLYDFLQRVCDPVIYEYALAEIEVGNYPKFMGPDDCGRICMPVEFSAAAYRFGHSLVRSKYPANADYPVIELFDERFGTLGFGPVPPELTVDWRFLLDVAEGVDYVKSKAIDHLLADELIRLPIQIVNDRPTVNDKSLAFRNLLRGYVLDLPSGQRLAPMLQDAGYPIDPGQDLQFPQIPRWLDIDAPLRANLENHTPLFFYIMREAGVQGNGERLGPVGSAIIMEVFGAMLMFCDTFLNVDGGWAPNPSLAGDDGFTLADLVRYVGR